MSRAELPSQCGVDALWDFEDEVDHECREAELPSESVFRLTKLPKAGRDHEHDEHSPEPLPCAHTHAKEVQRLVVERELREGREAEDAEEEGPYRHEDDDCLGSVCRRGAVASYADVMRFGAAGMKMGRE